MRTTFGGAIARIFNPSVLGLVVLPLLALAVFSFRNGQESIWNDEWFTINEIQQTDMVSFFKEIIHGENTPPLYYILLRWWSGNGRNLDASYLRFLSAVFAAVAVGLTFWFGRALYGNQVGLIAGLLLASSPYLCWYGQEIRSLTLFAALSVLSMITFYSYAKHPGRLMRFIGAVIVMILGLYTHYFFVFLIPAQLLYARYFDDGRLFKRWFFGIIIAGTVFCLWMPALLGQLKLNRTFWLDPPEIVFGLQVLANFSAGIFYHAHIHVSIFAALIFGILFFAGMVEFFTRPNAVSMKFFFTYQNMFLLIFMFVPVICPFILSFFKPMLYEGKRYLIFLLPLFMIVVARGMCSFKNNRVITALVIAVLCTNFVAVRQVHTRTQKRFWNKTSAALKQLSEPGDAVFSTDYTQGKILTYYGLGNAELIAIPDINTWKKQIRPFKRLWFITHIPNCRESQIFDQVLTRINERTLVSDEGNWLTVILYDCSGI